MLSSIILRSTAAFGGAPFRLKKCTALTSAAGGAAGGAVWPSPDAEAAPVPAGAVSVK